MPGAQRYYKLRPSSFLTLLFLLLSVASLVSAWMLPLPKVASLILSIALLCWLVYRCVLNANLSMGRSCIAFRLEDNEQIVLVLRDGRQLPGQVSNDSVVTPYLVILNVLLGEQSRRRSLLILPDAMGKDSFRLLRIALRWSEKTNQAPA